MIKPLSNFQSIFKKVAAKRGMLRQIDAAFVCQKFREIAPKIIHLDVLQHIQPKSYKDFTLTIVADHSAWSQEIHMNKTQLIKALNDQTTPGTIKELKVLTQKLHSQFPENEIPQ